MLWCKQKRCATMARVHRSFYTDPCSSTNTPTYAVLVLLWLMDLGLGRSATSSVSLS